MGRAADAQRPAPCPARQWPESASASPKTLLPLLPNSAVAWPARAKDNARAVATHKAGRKAQEKSPNAPRTSLSSASTSQERRRQRAKGLPPGPTQGQQQTHTSSPAFRSQSTSREAHTAQDDLPRIKPPRPSKAWVQVFAQDDPAPARDRQGPSSTENTPCPNAAFGPPPPPAPPARPESLSP